jgi:hypothetical protein
MRRRHVWGAALGATAALVACACVGAIGPTTEPSGHSSPSATATLTPATAPSCYGIGVMASAVPWKLSDMAVRAPVIVVGRVTAYGEPRWDTPDGSRPNAPVPGAIIVRPAEIAIERLVRGDADSVARAVVPGGQIGCDSTTTNFTEPTVNTRSLLMLGPRYASDGQWRSDYAIWDVWPIDVGDMVSTPVDGHVPLSQIERLAAATTLAPW